MTSDPWQDARRGGEEEPIASPQLGTACSALQDLDLMAKDEHLDLAVALIARGATRKMTRSTI